MSLRQFNNSVSNSSFLLSCLYFFGSTVPFAIKLCICTPLFCPCLVSLALACLYNSKSNGNELQTINLHPELCSDKPCPALEGWRSKTSASLSFHLLKKSLSCVPEMVTPCFFNFSVSQSFSSVKA